MKAQQNSSLVGGQIFSIKDSWKVMIKTVDFPEIVSTVGDCFAQRCQNYFCLEKENYKFLKMLAVLQISLALL